jgi:hypothetical protein
MPLVSAIRNKRLRPELRLLRRVARRTFCGGTISANDYNENRANLSSQALPNFHVGFRLIHLINRCFVLQNAMTKCRCSWTRAGDRYGEGGIGKPPLPVPIPLQTKPQSKIKMQSGVKACDSFEAPVQTPSTNYRLQSLGSALFLTS